MPDDPAEDRKMRYQRVAYYPGCALEGTAHAYSQSTKVLGKALGLELEEVKDWNCCGAMEVKNVDPKVQTYLSSRVMAIAAHEMKAATVMAPCNGCYHNLKKAEHDLAHDAESREVVEKRTTTSNARANDLKFSVFGYLDASADTQWIRVMPLRTLVTTTPEPLGARVTLRNSVPSELSWPSVRVVSASRSCAFTAADKFLMATGLDELLPSVFKATAACDQANAPMLGIPYSLWSAALAVVLLALILRAFYRAGLAAGGKDNGAPGLRPNYHPGYYAAFLLDPDGNNIEAVFHGPATRSADAGDDEWSLELS